MVDVRCTAIHSSS
uniref:Uncharacterized protein n=1 Tax=Arundo donax TaxID=35708 RepID=A0A0A8YWF2_ARUDO